MGDVGEGLGSGEGGLWAAGVSPSLLGLSAKAKAGRSWGEEPWNR